MSGFIYFKEKGDKEKMKTEEIIVFLEERSQLAESQAALLEKSCPLISEYYRKDAERYSAIMRIFKALPSIRCGHSYD